MKKSKIHWFDGNQKPRRKGIYKREYYEEVKSRWCYWDGKNFGCGARDFNSAMGAYTLFGVSLHQNLRWAGIIK